MKALILTAILSAAVVVQAEEATKAMYCGFTEPFYTLTIDLEKKEISKTGPDLDPADDAAIATVVVATNITVESDLADVFAPKYTVKNQDGTTIAKMALDMKGSDAMSDTVYPFSIEYNNNGNWEFAGCETEKIKSFNPYEDAYVDVSGK